MAIDRPFLSKSSEYPVRREYEIGMFSKCSRARSVLGVAMKARGQNQMGGYPRKKYYVHGEAFSPEVISFFWKNDIFGNRGWLLGLVKLETIINSHRDQRIFLHTLNITATISSPIHGLMPAHISNTTQPTLQISILKLYPFFWVLITSGAIQNTVPCIAVKAPPCKSSVRFEIPKSEILHVPDISTRMLSAFKSW